MAFDITTVNMKDAQAAFEKKEEERQKKIEQNASQNDLNKTVSKKNEAPK